MRGMEKNVVTSWGLAFRFWDLKGLGYGISGLELRVWRERKRNWQLL